MWSEPVVPISANIIFFKQKTADEMSISDWSSDVCTSDLIKSVLDVPDRAHLLGVGEVRLSGLLRIGRKPLAHHLDTLGNDVAGVNDGFEVLAMEFRKQIGRASCGVRECQSV